MRGAKILYWTGMAFLAITVIAYIIAVYVSWDDVVTIKLIVSRFWIPALLQLITKWLMTWAEWRLEQVVKNDGSNHGGARTRKMY